MGMLAAAFALFCLATFPAAVYAAKDDGAEIKLLVQSDKIGAARTALKLAAKPDKRYQIYFVDTAKFGLSNAQLILRLRDKGKSQTETTVKFRPADSSLPLDKKWRGKLEKEVEWLVGKGENISYSLKQEIEGTDLLKRPGENLDALFSGEQKKLFKDIMKKEFDPAKLTVFGPIAAEIWEWKEDAVDDKVSAELWHLGAEQILEVSRKAKTENLENKAAEFAAAFKSKGIALAANPESKTRKALEYYSKHP